MGSSNLVVDTSMSIKKHDARVEWTVSCNDTVVARGVVVGMAHRSCRVAAVARRDAFRKQNAFVASESLLIEALSEARCAWMI